MPYEITIEDHFAAAHYLDGYKGSCENIHGHNFKVEVTCSVQELDNIGISLDFKDLKAYVNAIKGENPTAENIARYIYGEIATRIEDTPAQIKRVTVYESEKYRATYYE